MNMNRLLLGSLGSLGGAAVLASVIYSNAVSSDSNAHLSLLDSALVQQSHGSIYRSQNSSVPQGQSSLHAVPIPGSFWSFSIGFVAFAAWYWIHRKCRGRFTS